MVAVRHADSGYVRKLPSRPNTIVMTRVVSVWNANAARSSISLEYSANANGNAGRLLEARGKLDDVFLLRVLDSGC